MNREERLLARILASLREAALPSSSGSGPGVGRNRPPTVGPGDDAAVLAAPDGRQLLLTVDAVLRGFR